MLSPFSEWRCQPVSDWNLYIERKLGLKLVLEESRLADAIARYTLGWNGRENEVGQDLLRDLARLHGWSFERARAGLVEKGLVVVRPGAGGRGNRDHYRLLLDGESPAPEREIPGDAETPAEERGFVTETPAQTPAEIPAQTPALERARREKGEGGRRTLVARASRAPAEPFSEDTCYACDPGGETRTEHGADGCCISCAERRAGEGDGAPTSGEDER